MKHQIHIAGPDDVIDEVEDELDALRKANEINKSWLEANKNHNNEELLPLYLATVREVEPK